MAKQLDKSYNSVNAYVCNRAQPNLETLLQISTILNVDMKDLISDSSERTKKTVTDMHNNNDVDYNDEGLIIDCLSGQAIKDTPEERVRQRFIKILQSDYGYPKDCILREIPVQSGSSILTNESDGSPIRADIVVYKDKRAALRKDQGNILFVVECKKPNVTEGYAQLVSYIIQHVCRRWCLDKWRRYFCL